MSWKKVAAVVSVLITNAGMWLLAIAGVTGLQWAWGAFVFFVWLFLFAYAIIMLARAHNPQDPSLQLKDTSLGKLVPMLSDVFLAAAIAGFGHWFYAFLIVVTQILCLDAHRPLPKQNQVS